MINFGALNWFDSFINKLKKALDYMNHMIYTYAMAVTSFTLSQFNHTKVSKTFIIV